MGNRGFQTGYKLKYLRELRCALFNRQLRIVLAKKEKQPKTQSDPQYSIEMKHKSRGFYELLMPRVKSMGFGAPDCL